MVDEKMQAADDITNVHTVPLRAIKRPAVPSEHISNKARRLFQKADTMGLENAWIRALIRVSMPL
jgi:hypothetical protein